MEDMEDLEARLYAEVYHENNLEQSELNTSDGLPPNLNKQSNKRYWQKSKNLSTQQRNFDNQIFSSPAVSEAPPKTLNDSKEPEKEILTETVSKTFVPYSSVLSSFMPKDDDPLAKTPSYEKKKVKVSKFPKAQGKLLNPLSKQGVTKSKTMTRLEIQKKKQKAALSKKKALSKVVAIVELDTEDSSDDVIPVELPPPPLISIESSEDEEEAAKKKRALSPSSSSIVSDDFIVAGDRLRLKDPFHLKDSPKATTSVEQKELLEKVIEMTKVSSTSSDSSARSSCERQLGTISSNKRKSKRSSTENQEDSIYGAKTKPAKPTPKAQSKSDSSDNEVPCVNARETKIRRRRSTGSGKKSADEAPNEPKMVTSTPMMSLQQRSRFITPSYTEDEFASMITAILRNGELQDEESGDEPPAVITVNDSTVVAASELENVSQDCEIIEQPVVVVTVPDEDENNVVSDSDDSMRGVKAPENCDLHLNVTQTPYEPHEYIRDGFGESSHEVMKVCETQVNPEIGWNDEMKFFYDGSWGGEHFNVSSIFDGMPRDPKLWKVNNADRVRTSDSGCRLRCKKCNEVGHIAVRCNRPKKRIVCFMCGEEGHRETRCPNSICLRCGKPNRLFATVCTACNKLTKKFCPLCNYQGHDIEQCPDKWRRYHSTTTNTTELNSDYTTNQRVFCSICARRGHFAENCNQFLKTISGMITSSPIKIVSHKPSYPRIYLNSFETPETEESAVLALYSFFPSYKFNFKFSRCAQLYPKFLEHFENQKKQQILPAIEERKTKKKRKREQKSKKLADSSIISINTTEGDQSLHHEDSNSNYSFSEFYKKPQETPFKSPETSFEKAIQAVSENIADEGSAKTTKRLKNPFSVALPDFIPLCSDPVIPAVVPLKENLPKVQIEREPEVPCDARLMINKEHYGMLSSEKGSIFLNNLRNRLSVEIQFKWDNNGNSLLISGLPSNQSLFHAEVREFLYHAELEKYEKNIDLSSQLPKKKHSLIEMLNRNLSSLTKMKYMAARNMVETMIKAENTLNIKLTLKCRKSLNLAFIGHAELCEGGRHVGELRKILQTLRKELKQGNFYVSNEIREAIKLHMKPIFGAINHGNYRALFMQYAKVIRQRKKEKKLLPNPLLS